MRPTINTKKPEEETETRCNQHRICAGGLFLDLGRTRWTARSGKPTRAAFKILFVNTTGVWRSIVTQSGRQQYSGSRKIQINEVDIIG
jgi:hypothetical protein